MVHLIDGRSSVSELDNEVRRLRRLLEDLERVRSGRHPDRNQLADAPVINDWRIIGRPEPCLLGKVNGHPNIKNERTAMTTALWLFAPKLRYARTLSRYYVLGRPAFEDSTCH